MRSSLIRILLGEGPCPLDSEADDEDVFSPPYTAEEDFSPGDKLVFVGDSLYKWRAESRLPAAFVARRSIKAGEQVFSDPTNLKRSDVRIIW